MVWHDATTLRIETDEPYVVLYADRLCVRLSASVHAVPLISK